MPANAERLQTLGRMAGGVAHDLNQTLTLIAGHAQLALHALADDVDDPTRARECLHTIETAATTGAEVLRQLLAAAGGPDARSTEPIDIAELLREVARFTAPRWRSAAQAEGRPIHLLVEVDGAPATIGWAAGLREALTNLIFNAVDALPRGGTIKLRAARTLDRVAIEVIDDGVGMPTHVRRRVFEPFFTTKGAAGSGLGLAQVREIARWHGGDVGIVSRIGEGTTVRVLLPVAAAGLEASSGEPDPNASSGAALQILVVDDEPSVADTLSLLLAEEGLQATPVGSAAEALAFLEMTAVDLVISDHSLGEGPTGLELIAEVRRRWPRTRAALLTAWGGSLDQVDPRAHGLEAVLAKPYKIEQLRALVAQVTG